MKLRIVNKKTYIKKNFKTKTKQKKTPTHKIIIKKFKGRKKLRKQVEMQAGGKRK
jgi:hypothetical protein